MSVLEEEWQQINRGANILTEKIRNIINDEYYINTRFNSKNISRFVRGAFYKNRLGVKISTNYIWNNYVNISDNNCVVASFYNKQFEHYQIGNYRINIYYIYNGKDFVACTENQYNRQLKENKIDKNLNSPEVIKYKTAVEHCKTFAEDTINVVKQALAQETFHGYLNIIENYLKQYESLLSAKRNQLSNDQITNIINKYVDLETFIKTYNIEEEIAKRVDVDRCNESNENTYKRSLLNSIRHLYNINSSDMIREFLLNQYRKNGIESIIKDVTYTGLFSGTSYQESQLVFKDSTTYESAIKNGFLQIRNDYTKLINYLKQYLRLLYEIKNIELEKYEYMKKVCNETGLSVTQLTDVFIRNIELSGSTGRQIILDSNQSKETKRQYIDKSNHDICYKDVVEIKDAAYPGINPDENAKTKYKRIESAKTPIPVIVERLNGMIDVFNSENEYVCIKAVLENDDKSFIILFLTYEPPEGKDITGSRLSGLIQGYNRAYDSEVIYCKHNPILA